MNEPDIRDLRRQALEGIRRMNAQDEQEFKNWYRSRAIRFGIDPNPDNPLHFYDYRAAHKAGAEPDSTGHWPSEFKLKGHPRLYINGIDTRTGEPVGASPELWPGESMDLGGFTLAQLKRHLRERISA